MRGRSLWTAPALLALIFAASACGRPEMETRTFRLQKLEAGRAGELLEPYVTAVEGGSMSVVTGETPALTIRQTPEALDRIGEVLAEFDKPDPTLTLRFRVIEADGFETDEESLADVLPTLREVLGFEGYRLLGETQAIAGAWGEVQQTIATEGDLFVISCHVGELRVTDDAGSVRLEVRLGDYGHEVLSTEVTVPIGRTVVLGTSRPSPQRGAFILTVEPTYAGA
ncbi:MAG: hypothetical protein PVF05_11610 [Gemmatimonadales bacterium]|jgi:hypothetical protein